MTTLPTQPIPREGAQSEEHAHQNTRVKPHAYNYSLSEQSRNWPRSALRGFLTETTYETRILGQTSAHSGLTADFDPAVEQ